MSVRGLSVWLFVFLIMPRAVHAQALSFSAPPDCGGAEELVERVSAVLGRPADVTANVAITRVSDAEFLLSVTMAGDTRVVSDRTCRALFESAVLMIALNIRPKIAQSSSKKPQAGVARPATPPQSALARVDASVPAARTHAFYSALWLDAGIAHGVVPGWDLSLGLGVQAGGKWLRGAASLHYSPPRDDAHDRVSVQSASARALLIATAPALGWMGLGVAGDVLFGRGEQLAAARRDTSTRAGGCLELGAVLFAHGAHRLALASDLTLAPQRAGFRAHREQPKGASEVVYRPGFLAFSATFRWQLQIAR